MRIQSYTCLLVSIVIVVMPFLVSAQTPSQAVLQELQAQINTIRLLIDKLAREIAASVAVRGQSPIITFHNTETSTVVAGSKKEKLAVFTMRAPGAARDVAYPSLTFTLEAPEDFSQKGLSQCEIQDGSIPPTTGTHVVNPKPSKADGADVTFVFDTPLTIAKGSSKTLQVACDVVKDPQGPATYIWRHKGVGSKKITLIREGSFVLEVDASLPESRVVLAGSKAVIATVFDLYASGEAVQLQTIGLQIDAPNPRAVSGYSLWDGEVEVARGMLINGDRNFIVAFAKPFEIPRDAHKLLTVKIDLADSDVFGTHTGDTIAINFNGSDQNFHLTAGVGVSSGRGMAPSTQEDTAAPVIIIQ